MGVNGVPIARGDELDGQTPLRSTADARPSCMHVHVAAECIYTTGGSADVEGYIAVALRPDRGARIA